jgi:hypothetical protein
MTQQRSSQTRAGDTKSSSNGRSSRLTPAAVARRASSELAGLLGRDPEAIISLERNDDGWQVGVEVVETRRIPDTADVIAQYAVQVDSRGRLVSYRRTRRYPRGRAQDD